MMHMSYWFGTKIDDFIFQGYDVVTTRSFAITCIALTIWAIVYEMMKISQIKLHQFTKKNKQVISPTQPTDSSSLLCTVPERSISPSTCITCTARFIEIVHYMFHVTLGYLLMLAVMTYNGYISIAVVIGSGIGCYIFSPAFIKLRLKKIQQLEKLKKLKQPRQQCSDSVSNETEPSVSIVPKNQVSEENRDNNVVVHI